MQSTSSSSLTQSINNNNNKCSSQFCNSQQKSIATTTTNEISNVNYLASQLAISSSSSNPMIMNPITTQTQLNQENNNLNSRIIEPPTKRIIESRIDANDIINQIESELVNRALNS